MADEQTTEQKILKAARTLFAKRGFDAVSTRDIVGAADVNISLIRYYFGSKEALYRACLTEAADKTLKIAETTLLPASTPQEFHLRLCLFGERLLEERIANLDAYLLTRREHEAGSKLFEELFSSTYIKTFQCITSYFKQAQDKKFIRAEVDPRQIANMFQGLLERELAVEKQRLKLFDKSLTKPEVRQWITKQIVDMLCYGILV